MNTSEVLNKEATQLTNRVKEAVLEIDEQAEVILYGSRARGDYAPDSDWDFLILLSRDCTESLKRQIRDMLYEIELEQEEVISSVIEQREEWQNYKITPLYQNIELEGVVV